MRAPRRTHGEGGGQVHGDRPAWLLADHDNLTERVERSLRITRATRL
jgi:hypothetical protein